MSAVSRALTRAARPGVRRIDAGLSSATGGGGGGSVTAAFDPSNTGSNITLSNGNKTATKGGGNSWTGSHAYIDVSAALTSGKHYIEYVINTNGGNLVLGFDSDRTTGSHIGDDASPTADSFGIYADGDYRPDTGASGLGSMATNTVVMCAIDMDNSKAWFGYDGTFADGPIDVGAGSPDAADQIGTQMYAGIDIWNDSSQITVRDESEAQYTPAGYTYIGI